MKTQLKFIQAISIIGTGLIFATGAFANELVNGGFELNPPTSGFGNHIGHPITPWVLGSGDSSNVIRTSQGNNSTGQGPRSDASNKPSGTITHYLDIADGKNDFYQTFKAKCSGEANFGGYFSTRANRRGTASVTLRNGTGTTGSIVGQSNPTTLPGGNSQTDPWKLVSYTSPVVAGNTYSLVIAMDNNMNFDEGFVKVKGCDYGSGGPGPIVVDGGSIGTVPNLPNIPEIVLPTPVDNCCPPINEQSIARQLTPVFQTGGGSNANYRLNFSATSQFNNQNQNYLNYVNSMQPPINALISTWRVFDSGPGGMGSTPVGPSTMIEEFFTTYHITNPVNHGNTSLSYAMKPNHWYKVQVGTYFNDGNKFFPKKCESSEYYVNWIVGAKSSGSSGNFVISDGKRELARIKSEPRAKAAPMKAVPMKRGSNVKRF